MRLQNVRGTFDQPFIKQVEAILVKHCADLFLKLSLSTSEQDFKQVTDFVFETDFGGLACRIRRPTIYRSDITIRAHVPGGYRTELQKMSETTNPRWYFYGWLSHEKTVADWVLVDCNTLRDSGLLKVPRKIKYNADGTGFVIITLFDLDQSACIIRRSSGL